MTMIETNCKLHTIGYK